MQDKIYLKNSVKEYHSIDEVLSDLKKHGLFHEIKEWEGLGREPKTIGYILFYTQLMRLLNKEEEHLSNDINVYKMLTINQVCDFLNLSRPTVYKLLSTGDLPYIELLGQKRIQLLEVLKYIQNNNRK
ncbi:MAG TPA: helix-turn-helix domain-containing protein [Bacteroidales bacterium]|jgi:excisionase family DNA binding protein|nr:helix-turn-helix domain-containing protein [Bacteroidales bacterium]